MTTEYTEHNVESTAAGMGAFHVRTHLTDSAPISGHKAPTNSILVIEGADRHGYRSAHRGLAKSLGYREQICQLRAANYDAATGTVQPSVTTYWI